MLFLLKTRGPSSAASLAGVLGITPMAVRQHLQALAGDGLVSFRDERRKVGRPARIWELTPAAMGRFPDTHAELTVDLLRSLKAAFGEEGLERVIAARAKAQRQTYAARIPAGAALGEKLAALAAARSDEGYMAGSTREADGSWLLVENHCPICAAAAVCQGFCRDELALFREVLGPGVVVEREDHLLAGARRCAYRVVATDGGDDAATTTTPGGPSRPGGAPGPAGPEGEPR
ncbi:MAG: metalloregulator ArsR/SmtB family transcription factor [Candidatus Sericytochromatia bacterium]|nr:metalloregulator ArsR/SmtB family transcription factor [Candidatus Sericytochromatia bacterium]